MLLIPPIALKLASAGYWVLSYYRGRTPIPRQRPPETADASRRRSRTRGNDNRCVRKRYCSPLAPQASGHARRHPQDQLRRSGRGVCHPRARRSARMSQTLIRESRERLSGRFLRHGLVVGALALGLVLALATVPGTDHWRDHPLLGQLDVD